MNEYEVNPKDEGSDEEILNDFRTKYKLYEDAESDNQREWLEDKKFTWMDEEQWEDADRRSRTADGRPCVTVNKVQTFVRQVVNDALQNKMAIRVRPVDDSGDIRTAKVIQGIARHIEKTSKAHLAYKTAFEDAVSAGLGFIRVTTKYRDEMSFDQDICIVPVHNTLSVFLDPMHQSQDASDAEWGGFKDRISKDEFKRNWPKAEVANLDTPESEDKGFWWDKASVLIAEFFRCEYKPEMLYAFDNGQGGTVALFESEAKRQGVDVKLAVKKRESYRKRVMWYKIGGCKVLERAEWPSKYIPIVPVIGREINIEGKRRRFGLTRFSKGSQKFYNLARSAQLEKIAMAPRAPFIVAEGQLEGHEAKWRMANVRRFPYLEYKPTSMTNGQAFPPPQRVDPLPVDAALTQETITASDEIKATTGIFDPALGNSENSQSGRAVLALQRQGQTSTFDFNDNLVIAISHVATIVGELIPVIIDLPQAVRILGENEKEEIVRVNDPNFIDPKTGKPVLYDVTSGKYDFAVDAGPSYATKRQEAAESIMAYIGTPGGAPFGEISGDILASAQDWEGADELAERYRRFLSQKFPGLVDEKDENGEPIKGPDPESMAKIQQLEAQLQEMDAALGEAMQKAEGKQIEAQTKLEIAEMDNATKIMIAKMGPEGSENIKTIAQEILELRALLEQQGPRATAPEPGPQPGEQMAEPMAAPIME